jgi:hypothetical protein
VCYLDDLVDLKAKGLRITWFAGNSLKLSDFYQLPCGLLSRDAILPVSASAPPGLLQKSKSLKTGVRNRTILFMIIALQRTVVCYPAQDNLYICLLQDSVRISKVKMQLKRFLSCSQYI